MSVYSALNDAQQRRAQGRWKAPHSDPCGWITRPTPAQRANNVMACAATDIQRHRQNDGLKNGLCEPRPVLQRAKASSDQSCLLTSANSGEREDGRA